MDSPDQASTATPEKQPEAFQLGICMAGAVSAGAYTAGVMDYLLEALEAYEAVRGKPGYPSHKIEIPAIGGASAGGMTAIITAAALQQGIKHIDQPLPDLLEERPDNMLYHSWVDLTNRDMFGTMLGTGDIKSGKVESAFNCDFIGEVAKRTVTPENAADFNWQTKPQFISPKLKLFTTLSNLQGFDYNVNFNAAEAGSRRPYYMQMHNDYACFELAWNNDTEADTGWMPLNIQHKKSTDIAMQAAMATGAFPIGLKARQVTRPLDIVNNNPFFDAKTLEAIHIKLKPDQSNHPYRTLNIDGGMINNEPFDKVREVLNKITGEDKIKDPAAEGHSENYKAYEDYKAFKSTIIMVAPFPSTKPVDIDQSAGLLNVVGLTLSAMIGQMRSKPSQINDATNTDCAGQFLIDPSRDFFNSKNEKVPAHGEAAIACGALGGFSGFINKEFRVHDYFIGRHNCKIFLRDYFTIPDDAKELNPIFKEGYKNIEDTKYRNEKDGSWQIIPIVNDVNYDFPKLKFSSGKDWPSQKEAAIDQYKGALKKRIAAIIKNITSFKPMVNLLVGIGVWVLKGYAANGVLSTIKDELKKWNLIEEE